MAGQVCEERQVRREQSAWLPAAALYLVKIGAQRKCWMMRGGDVQRLHLEARVADWVEME
jgi:hypothetical protein